MCICILFIYIYISIEICAPTFRLRFLHFGLKRNVHTLPPLHGVAGGMGYEVQDRRLPKDSRGPQQHAPLPCRRRGFRKRLRLVKDGGLAVVQDVLVSLVFCVVV